MFKKFFMGLILSAFLITGVYAASAPRPLKIDDNYKYGNIEKTLSNPQNDNYQQNNSKTNDERKTGSVLDVLNILALLIFLILVVTIILKKKPKSSNNAFRIISAKQLADGKTVYLLEVNSRQIIVGTTASKVDSIMPLDKSFSAEEIPPEYIEKLFNGSHDHFKNLE